MWKATAAQLPSVLHTGHVPKPHTHTWLRFNLLWAFLILGLLVPLPLWLYPYNCFAGSASVLDLYAPNWSGCHPGWVVVMASNCWMSAFLLLALARSAYAMWKVHRAHAFPSYRAFYPPTSSVPFVYHRWR